MVETARNNSVKTYSLDELFFSSEAAAYLGISGQRLSQLVKDGKLAPIKRTAGCLIFSKEDLDLRKQENQNISINAYSNNEYIVTNIMSPLRQEAIAYFTLQSFFNYSDKKCYPVFQEINNEVDFSKPLSVDEYKTITNKLKIRIDDLQSRYTEVENKFKTLQPDVKILKHDDSNYPEQLRMVQDNPPFIFARGNLDLLKNNIISVVGSRNPSELGARKAYQLSQLLGRSGIIVAAGLAKGIDTQAHQAALDAGKPTIAVIGTPINRVYPKENKILQEQIVKRNGLVISQFGPNENVQRWFFPLRNGTMSAISRATVIVEAGETSGALRQADYALKQGRLVFIPQSAIDNPAIKWPRIYIDKKGAYKFKKINELLTILNENRIISDSVKEKGIAQLDLFRE